MFTPSNALGNWALIEVLQALQAAGVLDSLQENESITGHDLAVQLSLQERELEESLIFVSMNAPEIIGRDHDHFFAGPMCYDAHFRNILYFSKAYTPVAHNLGALLSGTSRYGVDIARDARALAFSSEIYGSNLANDLSRLLHLSRPDVLIDLGCGTGSLLARLTSELGCAGVGVEVALAASVVKRHHQNSYKLILGDVAKPDMWCHEVPRGSIALMANFVMHEFLIGNSTQEICAILTRYQQIFPGATLYVSEYNGFTVDELSSLPRNKRLVASFYQFVHPLTGQGMPQGRKSWHQIFTSCKVILEKEFISEPNTTIYVLKL